MTVDREFGRIVLDDARHSAVEYTVAGISKYLADNPDDENQAAMHTAAGLICAGGDLESMAMLAGVLAVQLHIERRNR